MIKTPHLDLQVKLGEASLPISHQKLVKRPHTTSPLVSFIIIYIKHETGTHTKKVNKSTYFCTH